MSDSLIDVGAVLADLQKSVLSLHQRLTALEAAVIIQTGTVFGAQGDSDPMTLTDEINKPRTEVTPWTR